MFPTQVALQSFQGIVVAGRYGNRMMFSLVEGRVMYVPPIVAGKIEAVGIAASERFELCKAQIRNGHGRSVEWALRRLDPEEQLVDVVADAPAPAPAIPTNGNGNGTGEFSSGQLGSRSHTKRATAAPVLDETRTRAQDRHLGRP
jgi:hypothetical protein